MRIGQLTSDAAGPAISGWQAGYPPHVAQLFQTTDPFGPAEPIYLGIFDGGHLLSVVTLAPRAKGVYEVHLALKKGQAVAKLLPAFLSIRAQLFGQLNVRELVGWVPTMHRGIRQLAATVGFQPTGATLLQTMSGRRLVEWQQLAMKVS